MFFDDRFLLKKGNSHGDAESLHLVGAGDDTTIVIRQYGNGTVFQAGVEHTLTGRIEIIAVDQGKNFHNRLWSTWVTTPQTITSVSSCNSMGG